MWTYKPRQGRKAAAVVRSASAVVTLATLLIVDGRMKIAEFMHPRWTFNLSFCILVSTFSIP